MDNNNLPTMHVTDPNGIGFDVQALDIEGVDIRIWLTPDGGLRIESTRQERLRVVVQTHYSITLRTDDRAVQEPKKSETT